MMKVLSKCMIFSALFIALISNVYAKEFQTNTARLQGLDKVTGRVKLIDAQLDTEIIFGSFSIVVKDCQTRPPEETPENFAFIDVIDINSNGEKSNIFKGWMLSSSPSLNAIEHPIYDVWLLQCINGEVDEKIVMSKEDMASRDEITQKLQEKSHLKEINEAIEEIDKTIEEMNEIEISEKSLLSEKDQEILTKQLEVMGLLNTTPEILVSGFEDESLIENIGSSEKVLEEEYFLEINPQEEILVEEIEEAPKSLINFEVN